MTLPSTIVIKTRCSKQIKNRDPAEPSRGAIWIERAGVGGVYRSRRSAFRHPRPLEQCSAKLNRLRRRDFTGWAGARRSLVAQALQASLVDRTHAAKAPGLSGVAPWRAPAALRRSTDALGIALRVAPGRSPRQDRNADGSIWLNTALRRLLKPSEIGRPCGRDSAAVGTPGCAAPVQ